MSGQDGKIGESMEQYTIKIEVNKYPWEKPYSVYVIRHKEQLAEFHGKSVERLVSSATKALIENFKA